MKVLAVIPARMGSRRFPGKVLHEYQGMPLLYFVHHWVSRSQRIDRIVVATDDRQIKRVAESFGAEVMLTSKRHRTGSDRAAEVAREIPADLVLNVQADNFNLKAGIVDRAIDGMAADRSFGVGTLACRIRSDEDLFNPDRVKVVVNSEGRALWFSRFPIPYLSGAENQARTNQFGYLGHIGIYIYRAKVLQQFVGWPQTRLEKAESLEQLRLLEHGVAVRVFVNRVEPVSIDSPRDLVKLDEYGV